MQRIAVACSEDGSLSRHFGRSSHFEVFAVDDGRISALEVVRNVSAGPGLHHRHHQPGAHGHHHNLDALRGCDVVLCGGMGQGVANSLTQAGAQPVVVVGDYTPREAVEAYLSGSLETGQVHACCGHGLGHRHGQ